MTCGTLYSRVTLVAALLGVFTPQALAQRRVSEETILFRKIRAAVVTVSGDEGSGSGFLVDSSGIILTNDHVVGGSERIRVRLNDSTRVEARLLATDPKKDIAAIQVAPRLVNGMPILSLAQPSDTMVFEGEKVIAIGSPLNQDRIMTAGIVSKIEPTAIISDVNINHGNSGGPLINMNGEVIAINAFGDFSSQGGPGVSGSILITEAADTVERAHAATRTGSPPQDKLLPLPSRVPFPLDTLQMVAGLERFDTEPYDISELVDTGKFEVMVVTPIYDSWRSHVYEQKRAEHVKKREKKGGVSEGGSYDPTRQMREWMRYTGNHYAPVVTVQMMPEYGETGGSVLGNLLGSMAAGLARSGYRGKHKYEFKADFKDVVVTRNGNEVPDMLRGKGFIPLEFAKSTWSADYWGEDFARAGIFQCGPEWFSPDSAGFPLIEIRIASVERPNRPYRFVLPEETVRRVWADFAPHRALVGGRTPPVALANIVASPSGDKFMPSAVDSTAAAAPATGQVTAVVPDSTASTISTIVKTTAFAPPYLSGAPVTLGLKDGTLLSARSIEPFGLDGFRVTLTNGETKHLNAGKIRSVADENGNDWTKKVLDERKRLPK